MLYAVCCTLHIVSFYVACVHRIVRKKPQVERRSPAECSHRLSSPSCRTARAHRAAVPLPTAAPANAPRRCETAANLRRSVRVCERMRAGLDTPATACLHRTVAHHRRATQRGHRPRRTGLACCGAHGQARVREFFAEVSSSESAPGAHEPILKMDTASSVTSCTDAHKVEGARVP